MRQKVTDFGDASLTGWRRKIGQPVAEAVSKRTGLSAQQVRAIIGLAFLAMSIYSIAKRARRVAQEA